MNIEWFRKSTVGTQASLASAISRHLFATAGIRALSMRSRLSPEATDDGDLLLFDPHYKTGPVFYRVKQQHRHGINADAWNQCHALSQRHAGQSCIVIFEAFTDEFSADWSGALLIQSLKRIPQPEYGRNERPMKVYWPRRAFVELHVFQPDAASLAAEGVGVRDMGEKLTEILTPQKQAAMF